MQWAPGRGHWGLQYVADFCNAILNYDPPAIDDDALPPQERATFARIAEEVGLRGLPPAQAMQREMQRLSGLRYSLWRDAPPLQGMTTALADFMTRTQSGYCEYFAAAATLLLRAAAGAAEHRTRRTDLIAETALPWRHG